MGTTGVTLSSRAMDVSGEEFQFCHHNLLKCRIGGKRDVIIAFHLQELGIGNLTGRKLTL